MKKIAISAGVVLIMVLTAFSAFADGVIFIERPHPAPELKPKTEALPIKYHRVKVEIKDQVATTRIDQVFRNPYDRELEGTYIFPLPEDAAISDFAMYVNGEKINGQILEKEKARRIYEDIVRRMKDPALLEYIGRNMFKARVYPIPAKGEKRIELVYHQTLKYDAGMVRYSYPLDTERFSPTPLEDVSVSVEIKSKTPIKNVYSPSHDIDLKRETHRAVCGYEEKDVTPERDFVLYYNLSEKDVGLNLLSYRPEESEDGYFMMFVSPGEVKSSPIKKDIIFVLDTSGSMQNGKLDQAKDALEFCINSLNDGDRFNVISFATTVQALQEKMLEASGENRDKALEFVKQFRATGGTNINEALTTAVKMFSESKRPSMVVFLTDGQPTVGETGIEDIVRNVESANKTEARVFIFGVGYQVNTHLLDKLAEDNRGLPEYVTPEENIEVQVSSFYSKISEPVMSDIGIDLGDIETYDIYPRQLPDLFKGTQLVLTGRYRNCGHCAIRLKGFVNGEEKKMVFENTFPRKNERNDFIPRIWATRKIGYLLSEIRFKGEKKELVDEVISLSKKYGIMTPYTSYLVTVPGEDGTSRDVVRRDPGNRLMPQASPAPRFQQNITGSQSDAVGESAVRGAKKLMRLKQASSAPAPERKQQDKQLRYVGAKTFQLEDGVWIDTAYTEDMKVKEVKYMSDEYLDLLSEKPELGKYFALGEQIIVVFKGTCYKVTK